MRSKVFISLFIVFAMVATTMLPLSNYDNGNVSAAGGTGTEADPFLVSSVEELKMVGKGTNNPTGYENWTRDAHYKLTQNIEFGPGDDTNEGVMIDLEITYDENTDKFTVTLTPIESPITISSINLWIGTNNSENTEITAPADPGIYTMIIGGRLSDGTFAYAVEIEILPDMSGWSPITTKFNSNGNFNPIGNSTTPFKGTFNGAGFKISGMNIAVFTQGTGYAGLFGYTDNATITGLSLTDGYTIGIGGTAYVGGMVGHIGGTTKTTITGSHNGNNIFAAGVNSAYVSGIAGMIQQSESEITDCYNTGNITATGGSATAGGVAGTALATTKVTDCYNTGNITTMSTSNAYTGGITGNSDTSVNIERCFNTGDIRMTSNNGTSNSAYAGGIAGLAASEITKSHNTGNIIAIANGTAYIGGITGRVNSTNLSITDSHNAGNISAISNSNVAHTGGVVGYANAGLSLTGCFNIGHVNAKTEGFGVGSDKHAYAGGIIGLGGSPMISECYNAGNITVNATNGTARAGGISGHSTTSTISDCYNIGDIDATSTELARAGGIIGDTTGGSGSNNISYCYNTGNITATGSTGYKGGIAGYIAITTIKMSFFLKHNDLEAVGYKGSYNTVDAESSIPREEDELRDPRTFTEWDFNGIWSISNEFNDSFPVLDTFIFTLVLDKLDENGTIAGPNRIYGGEDAVVTITPDSGFVIGSIMDGAEDVTDQVPADGGDHIITNIFGDRVITVGFLGLETHTITVNTPLNGTVSADKNVVIHGSSVTITIIPNDGFKIGSVKDNGVDVTNSVSNNKYVIGSVVEDHHIEVVFEIVANPGSGVDDDNPETKICLICIIIIITIIELTLICLIFMMKNRKDDEDKEKDHD